MSVNTFQVPLQWQSCCQERKIFRKCAEVSSFQPRKRRSGQNAQYREKETLEEKVKKHLLSSFQKTKSTHISGPVFADRIEQVKKTKLEFELIKIVVCFID